jgi:hypothetical protein
MATLFLLLCPDPDDDEGEEYLAAYVWANSADDARAFATAKASEARRDELVWSTSKCTCMEAHLPAVPAFEPGEVTFGRVSRAG